MRAFVLAALAAAQATPQAPVTPAAVEPPTPAAAPVPPPAEAPAAPAAPVPPKAAPAPPTYTSTTATLEQTPKQLLAALPVEEQHRRLTSSISEHDFEGAATHPIDELLAAGLDINSEHGGESRLTPLHNAVMTPFEAKLPKEEASRKRTAAVKYLVTKGADIHKTDRRGRNALWFAIKAQDHATAKHLLDAGSSPNAHDGNGVSCLNHAVRTEDLEMVQLLLSKGAHKDQPDRFGGSALKHVSGLPKTANTAALKQLFGVGVDVTGATATVGA